MDTHATLEAPVYDPDDLAVRRDPHAFFARLREQEPVSWSPRLASWIVTSHGLGTQILMDAQRFSADRITPFAARMQPEQREQAGELLHWLGQWMVFRDPPEHSRLRRQLMVPLNPRVFQSLEQKVADAVRVHLDGLRPGDPFDFVEKFAQTMPGYVLMDILGVPREQFLPTKQYSNDLMLFIGGSRQVQEKYARARSGARAMADLFKAALDQRRAEGIPEGDVLGQLMTAEVDGRRMTDDELVASMMMLLNGAHETTTNALSNMVRALAAHPEAAAQLRGQPALHAAAVEEFLRYDSPVLSVGRLARHDMEFGGAQLRAGNRVYVMLVAANRDPAAFTDPDRLDFTRSPNPHIAFGRSLHFCLGAPLAKLEMRVALQLLLERYSSFEVLARDEDLDWHNSLVARGPTSLPVRFA